MNTKLIVRLLGYLVALSGVFVYAQEDPRMWDTEGVALRQGIHLEWERETAMHEDGSVCVVWSDARVGNRNIYAQMIDGDGNAVWEDEGVCLVVQEDCQQNPVVAAVEGGWIIAWAEYTANEINGQYSCSIYAQMLNMDGENLWRADGVLIETSGTDLIGLNSLQIVPDLNGGVVIAWSAGPQAWFGTIFAQRVSSAGIAQWADAVSIADEVEDFEAVSDGRGNMLIAWTIGYSDETGQDIYGAKLMADGTLPWGEGVNGIPISVMPRRQYGVRVCQDFTSAGMYCVWRDERNPDFGQDLCMQRVDSSGTVLWDENGRILCDAPNAQYQARVTPSMNGETQDGFFAVWTDFRVNSLISEIYGQKISETGNAVWEENGARVCGDAGPGTTGFTRENPWVSTDYAGGAVFTWSDTRNSEGEYRAYDLYASRLNAAGNNLWGDCGVLVQDGSHQQTDAAVVVRPDVSDVFFAFADWESGSTDLDARLLNLADGSPQSESSTRLIEGLDGDARDVKTVSMSNGRVAVVWEDYRIRRNALYYQIVDSDGEALFGFQGKQLVPDNDDWSDFYQSSPAVCPDGFGGFFTAFIDLRTGIKLIRLSHVNEEGEMDSDSAGVVVGTAELDQQNEFVVADGQGGCYVAWSGFTELYILDAYVMHMDANCYQTWAEPVRLTNTADMDDFVKGVVAGLDASCIVTWVSGVEAAGQIDVLSAHVDLNGTVDWSIPVCDADRRQDEVTLAADGQGGAYFAWMDRRSTGTDYDIFAQHISAEGSELWDHNGILVYSGIGIQQQPQVFFSPEQGLYIMWEDYRSGDNLDLYAQRIDAAGNLLWPETGLAICTADWDQRSHQLILNNLGGFTCVWTDSREFRYTGDIYGTDLLPDGTTSSDWWIEGSGGRISTANKIQYRPVIAYFGDHSALVVWEDWRSSKMTSEGEDSFRNLYMQRIITGSGIEAVNGSPQMPLAYALNQNYPNPFNPTTTISFSIAKAGMVSLAVYDLLGRSVTTLLNEHLNSGNYQVPWDASALPSGMYFYRLQAGEFSDVKKTVLLK